MNYSIDDLDEYWIDYIHKLRSESVNLRRKNKELRQAVDLLHEIRRRHSVKDIEGVPAVDLRRKLTALIAAIDSIVALKSEQERASREQGSPAANRSGVPPTTSRRREVRRHPAAPRRPNI